MRFLNQIPVLLLLGLAGRALAADPLAFGHLPAIEDVAISPQGSRLAYVGTKGEERSLQVLDLSGPRRIGTIPVGKGKVRHLQWADEKHLVVQMTVARGADFLGSSLQEWSILRVLDVETGTTTKLPQESRMARALGGKDVMNIAGGVQVRSIGGHAVLFARGTYVDEGYTRPMLFRYDLDSDEQSVVRKSRETAYLEDWVVDGDGQVVGDWGYDLDKHRYELRALVGGQMHTVARGEAEIDIPHFDGIGADGISLIARLRENDDWVAHPVSLADGSVAPPIEWMRPDIDFCFDPQTERLTGWVQTEDEPLWHFFDPGRQARWKSIVAAYPGARVELASASADFSRVAVRVEQAGSGFHYDFIDMRTRSALTIGDVYDNADPPLATTRINYTAADGLHIPAYLTLPAGRPARGLPLVVLPHGGPAMRDHASFEWMSQALAQQGYAVLRPNFRGSAVDGDFLRAGYGQWGRRMQTDLSDGVRFLTAQGTIDPARVCIAGASYGGYAAMAAITLDPGPWRCAVSISGLSDLDAMMEWIEPRHLPGPTHAQRYWLRFFGADTLDSPVLSAISPARHIGPSVAPLLLIHGRDDSVVPIRQSRIMESALRERAREVEFVELEGEDHYLSGEATRLRTLQVMTAFLRRNNPADPPVGTR